MSGLAPSGAQRILDGLTRQAALDLRPLSFDSGPLIDYIIRVEPVTSLLRSVLSNPSVSVVISAITLAEVVTRPASQGDLARVSIIHNGLLAIPHLRIADLDQPHAIETAIVRGQTGLKLPDAAVVATPRLAKASALIGNDRQSRHKPLGVPYHHTDDILAPR